MRCRQILLFPVIIFTTQLLSAGEVKISLEDAETGKNLPGLISIEEYDGKSVFPPELMNRGFGLSKELGADETESIHKWLALPQPTTVNLPEGVYIVKGFSGLETEMKSAKFQVTEKGFIDLKLTLNRFFNAREQQLYSGNTHLHLMKINREESDRYLKEIPAVDDLDLVFVSYLERAGADVTYISNQYWISDLEQLSAETSHHLGNGEEHRNNLPGAGSGYGHVMLLDIPELIQPVSIGQGIMKTGDDVPSLQRGIDKARRDGGTVVWCHNDYGLEDIPNLVTGRIDALNIHDGGRNSNYDVSYYRYLEAGLRVPFSTGTDWFQFDFSRVYVPMVVAPTNSNQFIDAWLMQLKQGHSMITNGPLLTLQVEDALPGDQISLDAPTELKVTGKAYCRNDFRKLELIVNGQAVKVERSKKVESHYEAEFEFSYKCNEPAWVALRTPPLPIPPLDEVNVEFPVNELGQELYSHTSPVYVTLEGRSRLNKEIVRGLIEEVKESRRTILKIGRFPDEQSRAAILDVYQEGLEKLENSLLDR
ncbi:MAG: CehA/McbA family metallohydrolase [Planctomycetaceae bacterium]